jgi:hypothetical protein
MRRLLDLHHSSRIWIIDEALAKLNAERFIDMPKARASGRAAWPWPLPTGTERTAQKRAPIRSMNQV